MVRRGAVLLIIGLSACAGPRELLSSYVSDAQSMQTIAVAAEACGYENVRLVKTSGLSAPMDTRLQMQLPAARRKDRAPVKCMDEWFRAHPEIEYEIMVRTE